MNITIASMQHGYPRILKWIVNEGMRSSPRGLDTYEIIGTRIVLTDPHRSLATGIGRNLNLGIAAIEALQLIGGFSAPGIVTKIGPRFKEFMDGDRFWGAYGTRIGDQLRAVIYKIRDDPDTRQAVVTLWYPDMDNTIGMHDYPCTVSLKFYLRDGKLTMITDMRSSDAWLGIPYDIFQFTQLQITLAKILNVEVGVYIHQSGSLHLYHTDVDKIRRLQSSPDSAAPAVHGLGRYGAHLDAVRHRAHALAHGQALDDATDAENWYLEQIRSHT